MIKGIYTSSSGMLPRVLKQEVFANNMANAKTVGFKKDSVFLHELNKAEDGLVTDLDWEIPMVDDVYIDYSQGSLEKTERSLDTAINGDGFFVVQTPAGERYTRCGVFSLTPEGTLVDGNNNPVLSEAGPINISGDEISISSDGFVSSDGESIAKMKVVDFAKPYNLNKTDYGYLTAGADNVKPVKADNYEVLQGYVESSNVNIIDQMVDMMISFRAYETGQKAIQTQDETLNKAVNELGRVR
ncbi:MAG: flagellar basal-body rod protein FlgF [candidate division Zixibacteria bacterium]|nr:flagellar basal-body rod protein FlgF [candidate division Zixibacteria bacterium]